MRVCGIGGASSVNLFSLPLLWKIEIYLIHLTNFKYNSGQDSRPGPPVILSSANFLRTSVTLT